MAVKDKLLTGAFSHPTATFGRSIGQEVPSLVIRVLKPNAQ